MSSDPTLRPFVFGANHRSSSLSLRDRLFVEDADVPGFLDRLKTLGIDQALIISTCDRVEIQAMVDNPAPAEAALKDLLADRACTTADDLAPSVYVHADDTAVRQIFAVAAALDSQVVGEPQVLGQVKACHRLARDAGMVAGELEGLLQAAYATAKRVRTDTRIGERPVSIASVAAELARDLHGDLDRCAGLLIGTGDMGELVAQGLVQGGLSALTVVHRRRSRSEALAAAMKCKVADWDELGDLLPWSDIVITAFSGRHHVLDPDKIQAALKKRRRNPMFIVDTGIPGDVDPAVNRIDEAFLYDLGDLERVALDGLSEREADAVAAWSIIDEAVGGFCRIRSEREAVPLVTRLRETFEAERLRALADAGGDADKATRLLTSRLLHGPPEALRGAAAVGADMDNIAQLLDRLFGLDRPEDRESRT